MRSHQAVAPVLRAPDGAEWGPWLGRGGRTGGDGAPSFPPLPAYVAGLRRPSAGDFLATFIFCARRMPGRFLTGAGKRSPRPAYPGDRRTEGWIVLPCACTLDPAFLPKARLEAARGRRRRCRAAFPRVRPGCPRRRRRGCRRRRKWRCTERYAQRAAGRCGSCSHVRRPEWIRAPVATARFFAAARGGSARRTGITLYLYRGECAVAVFGGLSAAALRAARGIRGAGMRRGSPSRRCTDDDWHRGIARRPFEAMMGVARCAVPARAVPAGAGRRGASWFRACRAGRRSARQTTRCI